MFVAVGNVRIGNGLLDKRVDEGISQFGLHQIYQLAQVFVVDEEIISRSIVQCKVIAF